MKKKMKRNNRSIDKREENSRNEDNGDTERMSEGKEERKKSKISKKSNTNTRTHSAKKSTCQNYTSTTRLSKSI